jgi:nickel/cobalt transporter (NicO) family protein
MTPLSDLLQQGSAHAWLFVPSAILLGALHGLEPGHSKTMMAAFIIAIRGTVRQAILLGLAATLSHTLVVWLVALLGMRLGRDFNAETSEPYFQVISAVLILAIAGWMVWRTWREQRRSRDHHHRHVPDHAHGGEIRRIDTGHGVVELSIQEDGMPPRFWLCFEQHGKPVSPPRGESFTVETVRPDGTRQLFKFADRGRYLESTVEIPEPHAFNARLEIRHGGHGHSFTVQFAEHHHGYDHGGLDVSSPSFQDAHEMAHAADIRRRFGNRNVTTAQIVMFGLTGGLIPCPAAITVLLLCLQLKQFTLGVTLVLCFSIGLALTMVFAGVIAALSVRHVSQRWPGFGILARRAPYFSGAVIGVIGLFTGFQGLHTLALRVV